MIQITKQEAIDLLDNLIGMIEDNHGSDYDSAIRMAIDALKPKWILCSETMPEEAGAYLCTCKDAGRLIITLIKWQPRMQSWNLTGARTYWKVIAWMPLPEPYMEEDEAIIHCEERKKHGL